MGAVQDFDITKNIKLIEMLKCQLLTNIADLHTNLSNDESDLNERGEILSDLLIITYMLANRLGFSYGSIDVKAIKKLKFGILDESQFMHNDMSSLLRHLYREF